MEIEPYKIESEAEADEHLDDLLREEKHRNIDEIVIRAKRLIFSDPALSAHFVHQGRAKLKALGDSDG